MNRIIKKLFFCVRRCKNIIGIGNNITGVSLLRRFRNFEINGVGNTISIKSKLPNSVHVKITGNNHRLIIDERVVFSKGEIYFEDNNCEIYIGEGTSIGEAHLAAAENGSRILIGRDCMLSKNIYVVTTDSHSILSLKTGDRTNPPGNVVIEDHVWIGQGVTLRKGISIGSDSVISGSSVVTKSVPKNSIAAGIPAKIVRDNITWLRERI